MTPTFWLGEFLSSHQLGEIPWVEFMADCGERRYSKLCSDWAQLWRSSQGLYGHGVDDGQRSVLK